MPRYFFDFTDGEYATEDSEGHEVPSLEDARGEARKALSEVYLHEPRDMDRRSVSCSVRDDKGTVIYSARLTLDGRRSSDV